MKKVATIAELHKLIPKAKKLEGVNFKDMKTLLTTVIEVIEKSGKWEFVQYVSGNPSLFIVNEKEIKTVKMPSQYSDMEAEINAHYNAQVINTEIKPKNPEYTTKKEKSVKKEEKTESDGARLFPQTSMPW